LDTWLRTFRSKPTVNATSRFAASITHHRLNRITPLSQMEEALQNLNIIFCELNSLLILSSENVPPTGTNKRRSVGHVTSVQAERVSEHVVQLLHGESGLSSQLGRSLSLGAYIALSPTIWSLLSNPSSGRDEMANKVFAAVIEHAIKTPSKSTVKKATIEFLGRLVLVRASTSGHEIAPIPSFSFAFTI
jgi:pre-rRNA-processing protein IPI1